MEQTSCLLLDLEEFAQITAVSQAQLAATLADPNCTALCQACLIMLLYGQAIADAVLQGTALHRALQWAGLHQPGQDVIKLATPRTLLAASAVVINLAVLPEGEQLRPLFRSFEKSIFVQGYLLMCIGLRPLSDCKNHNTNKQEILQLHAGRANTA